MEALNEPARAIDDVAVGQGRDAEALVDGGISGDDDLRRHVAIEEGADVGPVVVDREGDQVDALGAEIAGQRQEARELGPAGLAPGCPEADNDGFAIIGKRGAVDDLAIKSFDIGSCNAGL